jgi:hypothetical protein
MTKLLIADQVVYGRRFARGRVAGRPMPSDVG